MEKKVPKPPLRIFMNLSVWGYLHAGKAADLSIVIKYHGKCEEGQKSAIPCLHISSEFCSSASVEVSGTKFHVSGNGSATFQEHFSICLFLIALPIS